MKNNYKKDFFWNSIGVFAQNAISPLLLIAVTRINGVYDSGIFSYAMAVALVFWAFGIWGGRTYQVSDLEKRYADHSYIIVRVMLGVVMLGGSVLFCVANGYDVFKSSVILGFVVFKVLESIADALYGVLQRNNKLYVAGISLLAKAILGFVVFVSVDILTGSLLWSAISLMAVNIIVIILYDLPYARRDGYRLRDAIGNSRQYTQQAAQIIKRCAPIAAVLFLSMFSLNIPRYFLDRHHTDEIGYFGILVMPITVLALVITFFLQPKIIYLTKIFANKQYKKLGREIAYINAIVVAIGLIGLAASYAFGIPLLSVVFGVDFSMYFVALLVVVIGAVANGIVSVYMNIFTIIRHFKILFYTLLWTNIGLTVMCVSIIREHGLLGSVVLYAVINTLQACILAVSYTITIKRINYAS